MNQDRIESYRKQLLTEKERLRTELAHLRKENAEANLASSGEDQNFEDHMGDAASDLFERERDLSLEQNVVDLSAQVDEALSRIDAGTYGVCAVCGRPIAEERLKALPYTDVCLEDKQREEGPR